MESENKKRELTIKELQQELTDAQKTKEQLQAELSTLKQQAEEKAENTHVKNDETIKERVNEKVDDDKRGHWWNRFMG